MAIEEALAAYDAADAKSLAARDAVYAAERAWDDALDARDAAEARLDEARQHVDGARDEPDAGGALEKLAQQCECVARELDTLVRLHRECGVPIAPEDLRALEARLRTWVARLT